MKSLLLSALFAASGAAPVDLHADPADRATQTKAAEAAARAPYRDRRAIVGIHWPETADASKAAADAQSPIAPQPHQMLPTGHRRVTETERAPMSPAQIEEMRRLGKSVVLDSQTGERMRESIRDFLPENWRLSDGAGLRTDSLGNPIVNETPGLPAWAQRDVDALRRAIGEARDTRITQIAAGQDASETANILGNFLGQAIARNIAVGDLLSLRDADMVDAAVARSILSYLHYYENQRFVQADDARLAYTPTSYPREIAEFAAAHGADLAQVQDIEPPQTETRGGTRSSCYDVVYFARGMTYLTGQTDIWAANGVDDTYADIPTGFPLFFFYDCQDTDNNDYVRVSTNGYISFFQQGGGATEGALYANTAIPSLDHPDGFAAPWWDDLFVEVNQGSPDRVSYKTEGASPSRVFTVEWFSVARYAGSTTDYHYFQVKLHETTDVVEFHYGFDWVADGIDSATGGMENFDGSAGDCAMSCDGFNNTQPFRNYRFVPAPRPSNDYCVNAIQLINGASIIGDLHHATPDGTANCGWSNGMRDLWYKFIAPCAGTLSVDTCGSRDIYGPGTGIDTVLALYADCPGHLGNLISCQDDNGPAGCSANDSALSLRMPAGQQVYIRVANYGETPFRFASGRFILNLNFQADSPPANDDCDHATPIANGQTRFGTLSCATNDGVAACGSSHNNADIWYQFTAPAAGTLQLDLCGTRNNAGPVTGPDGVLSVHGGCAGTLDNELVCNDDGSVLGCDTLDSRVILALSQGENVKIRVSHFGSDPYRLGNGVTMLNAEFGCTRPCPGDVNYDGAQDISDLSELLAHFGACLTNPLYSPAADLNCDNCVTLQDLANLLATFGSPCPR